MSSWAGRGVGLNCHGPQFRLRPRYGRKRNHLGVVHYVAIGTRVLEDALAFQIITYCRHVYRSGTVGGVYSAQPLGGRRAARRTN
jgi:hypothetical protein